MTSGCKCADSAGLLSFSTASTPVGPDEAVLIVSIAARRGRVCFVVIENRTPTWIQAVTTEWLSNAESIRASRTPVAPAAHAVVMATATKLAAPLAEPTLPRRSRVPATTGAAIGIVECRQQRMQSPHTSVAVVRALFAIPIHPVDRGITSRKA
jgi:hypothetical protein